MSRHENEDISALNLPDDSVIDIESYNDKGELVNPEDLVCALKTFNKKTNITKYRILCTGSQFFNPRMKDAQYMKRNRWELRRVNRVSFNLYVEFLKRKRLALLYQAEREL